jgi:glyoxylase-like metal-dependent hydrolase (beta-lactamase superfamily II)
MSVDVYQFRLGAFECAVINDFSMHMPLQDLVANADEQGALEHNLQAEETVCYDCLFINTGQHKVLVDSGQGSRREHKGRLLQGLLTLGVQPSDVDLVAITHGDGDHIGGLVDEAGQPTFSNARHVMWDQAWKNWMEGGVDLSDWPQEFLDFVRQTLAIVQDKLELVPAETEFLPGMRLSPAIGHRHEHSVINISSQGQRLLHAGDALIHPIFITCPHWYSVFDVFPEQAISVKKRLLDQAAAQDSLVFGSHMPFPGLGRVRKENGAWRWLPL